MTSVGYSYKDGWANIDQTQHPAYYVEFIDQVRLKDDAPEQYQILFDKLAAQPGETILDVGCGTGGTTRALPQQVDNIGQIVGLDNSRVMLVAAQERATGLDLPLRYEVGDARQMPFESNSFDRCYADGVFEIIPQPELVLAEMKRVLRPGGRLVISTGDIDATMIAATNKVVTRRIIHYASDFESNGWMGRELPALLHDLGLVDISITTRTAPVRHFDRWAKFWWQGWAENAQKAGVISEIELADWLADLQARYEGGKFFATWAGVIAAADKSE